MNVFKQLLLQSVNFRSRLLSWCNLISLSTHF